MKELSPNNKQLKSTMPILLTVIGLILCIVLLKHNLLYLIPGIIIVGGIGFIIIYKVYSQTENIFYDSDFLYLKSEVETRKIELNKIMRVKLTLTDQRILGFQYHKYRIEFINGIKMIDSVTFWTGNVNSRIQNFEKHLNYYSPKTQVNHSASTFDQ
jgi:hypothetical protein